MMNKRILSLVLSLVMLTVLVPFAVPSTLAADDENKFFEVRYRVELQDGDTLLFSEEPVRTLPGGIGGTSYVFPLDAKATIKQANGYIGGMSIFSGSTGFNVLQSHDGQVLRLGGAYLDGGQIVRYARTPILTVYAERMVSSLVQFSGGSGTDVDPYIITTAEQLVFLAETIYIGDEDIENGGNYNTKVYKLGNDIDLSSYQTGRQSGWLPIGNSIGSLGEYTFDGIFDGNGHIITGLYINDAGLWSAGLFGRVRNATIKNLGIVGASIEAAGAASGLVGETYGDCVINNCYTTGTVSIGSRGGNSNYAGGLVGGINTIGNYITANSLIISESYSTCDVTNSIGSSGGFTGGILGGSMVIGVPTIVSISNCYATGNIGGGRCVGGLAGNLHADSSITNSYSTGNVKGKHKGVGGLVGNMSRGSITDCAALNPSVKATENDVGRIVGYNDGGTLSNNRAYSDMGTDGGAAFDPAQNGHDKNNGADFHSRDPEDLNKKPQTAPNLNTAAGWAQERIQSAYEKGFIPADLQYNYSDVITRQDFCRMAVKWVEYKTGKTIDAILSDKGVSRNSNAFTDTSDPDILAAFALGITSGTVAPTTTTPGKFTPDGEFNRQQAAVMIMNTCKVIGMDTANPQTSNFVDLNDADSWALTGINFVRANGIMGGASTDPSKPTFNPNGTYTRQESIVTFDNIK